MNVNEEAKRRSWNAFKYLSFEVRGLQAAAYVLAVAALLSSLLALVRDRLFAHAFGASTALDLYYASFRIPDLIFVGTAALVSVYILIPEIVRRTHAEQRSYIDTIVVGFSFFAVLVSGIAALLAPAFLEMMFPKLVIAGHLDTLVALTRILLLQPIFLGISNIFAAITQASHRYALYAASPLVYNLSIIVGILALYPIWGFAGLAWGVVLGAALHAAIQLPAILGDGFFSRLPRLHSFRVLLDTVMLSLPRALALSMNQFTLLGLTVLAGFLAIGSIAVFVFAYNLAAVPLAIIGASYSVAAFPTLALAFSKGDRAEFVQLVATAARYVIFWSIPASMLILVLRAHIVRVILGSGAFSWSDTRLTAAAFAVLSFALVAQGIMLLLVRGYYAAGRSFVPFVVAAGVAFLTLVLAIAGLFVLYDQNVLHAMESALRVDDIAGSNVLVLALAYAVAAITGAIVLTIHFEYRFRGLVARIVPAMFDAIIAGLAGALAAYIFLGLLAPSMIDSEALSILLQGLGAGITGILVTAATYYLLGSKEFIETYASLRARIWRTKRAEEVTITTSAEGPASPTSA